MASTTSLPCSPVRRSDTVARLIAATSCCHGDGYDEIHAVLVQRHPNLRSKRRGEGFPADLSHAEQPLCGDSTHFAGCSISAHIGADWRWNASAPLHKCSRAAVYAAGLGVAVETKWAEWSSVDAQRDKTTLRSATVASLVTLTVLVVGLWFLNNTRPGLRFKCEVLNDLGACLVYGLSGGTESLFPPVTEDPQIAEERRRQAEEQRSRREADQAVERASFALETAVDSLRLSADAASDAADELDDSTELIRQAVDRQESVFDELVAMIAAGSTGQFWVDDVTFKLYDVEFARGDVDFAVSGFEFNTYYIESALTNHDQLVADIDAAASKLDSAISQYPNATAPAYSVNKAQEGVDELLAKIDLAIAAYETALGEIDAMIAEADTILEEATSQALSVGAG